MADHSIRTKEVAHFEKAFKRRTRAEIDNQGFSPNFEDHKVKLSKLGITLACNVSCENYRKIIACLFKCGFASLESFARSLNLRLLAPVFASFARVAVMKLENKHERHKQAD